MALEVINTLTALSQGVQAIAGMAKAANQVEFNNKLIEVQNLILDLQLKVGTLQEENFTLKRALEETQAQLANKGAVQFVGGAYWKGTDGPFCPTCFDEKHLLVRLRYMGSGGTANHSKVPSEGYWDYTCDLHKMGISIHPDGVPHI